MNQLHKCGTEPVPESEIPQQMGRLQAALTDCMSALGSLEARLSPVTRAEPPTVGKADTPKLTAAASTAYGASLAEMVGTVAAMNANIGSLLTRLEV